MRIPSNRVCVGPIAAFALSLTLIAPRASAMDLRWDVDGDPTNGFGGNGIWDYTVGNLFWDNDGAAPNVPWTDTTGTDVAIFQGTAGTVSLGAPVAANGLTFGVTGYTLDNGGTAADTLTLAGTTPTLTVTNGTDSATISAILAGSANLTKAGLGTLVLSGANTFTGTMTVSAGTLNIQNAAALGTTAGATSVTSGAELQIQGGITVTGEALTLNGTGTSTSGALHSLSGTNTWTGAITLGSNSNVGVDAGALTLSGAIGGASMGLTKVGAGTLILGAVEAYTGPTSVSAGVLEINGSGQINAASNVTVNTGATLRISAGTNAIADNADVTLNANSFFEFNTSGTGETIGALAGSGTVTRTTSGTSTLTANNGGETSTFSGVVENGSGGGTIAFTKAGAGTLTLTGANTFTGTLTVNNGTAGTPSLVVSGASGSLATATINVGDNNGGNESMTVGAVGDVWSTGALNRLADTANVTVNGTSGGGFTYVGPATGSSGNSETIGTLTISSGRNNVTLVPGTGNDVQLTAGSLVRANNGTVQFRSDNLGGTGPGSTRLVFTTAPTLTGANGADGSTTKSILSFAYGGGATSAGSDFVTYDATNGIRLLAAAEYDSTIAGTTPLRNVSVGAAGETVLADSLINSLRLTGGATVTINGGKHVLVNSGAVLIAGNGTASTGGITGSSGFLDFGASEGIIHLAQNTTATTAAISARLAGTNGFSYGRSGDAVNVLDLGGDNTIIGTARINQGTIRLTSAGALNDNYPVTLIGRATSALQLNGNSIVLRDLQASTGTLTIQNGAATPATLTTYLTAARTFSSALANGSTGVLNLVVSGNTLSSDQDASATGSVEIRSGAIALTGTGGTLNDFTSYNADGGTLRMTNASGSSNSNRLRDASPISLAGGALDFDNNASGASFSETVGAITINPGTNFISVDKAASGQTSVLTAASLARNAGGAVVFNSQNNGTAIFDLGTTSQSRLVLTSIPTLDDGIIGGWAVVQTSATMREFAKYVGSGTISVTALTGADYTAGLSSGSNPTQNVLITASPAALTSSTQVNSLTLNQATATTVDVGAGNTLRIENGGIIANNDLSATFVNGTLTAGTGANTAGELIIHTISAAANPLVIDSVIADNGTGAVTLTKAGAGVLDLQGVTNTYTGKTYVSGGTLRINADGNLGAAPASATAGALTFASTGTQTLDVTETMTLNANRSISVGAGTTVISVAAGATAGTGKVLTYNGSISQLGTAEGNLTFQSNASTTLLGAGTISANLSTPLTVGGTFRLEAGSVTAATGANVIGRSFQVGLNGSATYTQAGGTLTVGAGITDSFDVGVSGSDTINKVGTLNLAGTSQLTANVDVVRIGAVTGGTGSTGKGTLTLATNNAITAGTQFLLGDSGGPGQNNAGQESAVTLGSGTNFIMTQTMTIGGRKSTGTVTLPAGGALELAGFGQNTLDLFIARNNVDTATISTGLLDITNGALTASIDDLTIATRTGSTAGQNGGATGTLTLGSGVHSVSANRLLMAHIDNAASGQTTAISQANVNMGGGNFTVNGDVVIADHVGTNGAAKGTLNLTGGTFTVGGNITKTSDLRASGLLTVDGATLDLTNGTGALSQLNFRSGTISNVASGGITLDAVNVTNGNSVGLLTDALTVRDVAASFSINLTSATASTGGIHYEAAGGGSGATISGPVNLGTVARTVNVEDSAAAAIDLTISGAVSGAVGLTKTGNGTLALNSTVAGSVQLNAGTLGGTGNIAGAVNVASGATIAPGASIGTLAVGSLTLASTSVFKLELNTTTATVDLLNSAGAVDLALATLTAADLGSGTVTAGQTFTFITGTSITNQFAGLPDGALITIGGNDYNIDYTPTSVALVAVPEPGSLMALMGGVGVLTGLKRFRRRR